jgi:hypothetical protein
MDKIEQMQSFLNDLGKLYDYYAEEYELTNIEVIGALEAFKISLCREIELKEK